MAQVVVEGLGVVITAVAAGAAAVIGARVGGRQTREAAAEAFERQTRREDDSWRRALRWECLTNIRRGEDSERPLFWTFRTDVLRVSPLHAHAFSDTVLERAERVINTNEKLEAELERLRPKWAPGQPGTRDEEWLDANRWRAAIVAELRVILNELERVLPPPS